MFMISYQLFDFSQLMRGESPISGNSDWPKPEFRVHPIAANVNVGGLARVVGPEVELVRSRDLNRRHGIKMAAAS
jgi:hypothetical protein